MIAIGRSFTWSLVATNLGPDTVSSVTVTDALPSGVTFQSVTPSQGSCTNIAGTIICELGSLAAGQKAIVNIEAVPFLAGNIPNTATVHGNLPDPVLSNNTATVILPVPADYDNDGIADEWEWQRGLNPQLAADATRDDDGDGQNNRAEFLAGTEPFDADSVLRITHWVAEGEDLRLFWQTGSGRTNALLCGPSLTNITTELVVFPNTSAGQTNYLHEGALTNQPSLFYRVKLLP